MLQLSLNSAWRRSEWETMVLAHPCERLPIPYPESICLSIYRSKYRSLSLCLSACPSVRPSVCLTVCLSIYLSIQRGDIPCVYVKCMRRFPQTGFFVMQHQVKSMFGGTTMLGNLRTSSTAQGGGGSFKNRKPTGEVSCFDAWIAQRIHGWTERWLERG